MAAVPGPRPPGARRRDAQRVSVLCGEQRLLFHPAPTKGKGQCCFACSRTMGARLAHLDATLSSSRRPLSDDEGFQPAVAAVGLLAAPAAVQPVGSACVQRHHMCKRRLALQVAFHPATPCRTTRLQCPGADQVTFCTVALLLWAWHGSPGGRGVRRRGRRRVTFARLPVAPGALEKPAHSELAHSNEFHTQWCVPQPPQGS